MPVCGSRASSSVNGLAGTLNSFSYDSASRLHSVSDGTRSATYNYLANSALVQSVTFRQGTTVRLTTAKAYDALNRLTSISSLNAQPSTLTSFASAYNDAQQRTRVDSADGSYWVYGYDSLGQVVSGKKSWKDGPPMAGQSFEYTFDDIGKRTSATRQTSPGASPNFVQAPPHRLAGYGVNALNQTTGRTVPGFVDVLGDAAPNATVTVNGQATVRNGGYFYAEVPVNNAGAPQFPALNTTAEFQGASKTESGKAFVAQNPESYLYDGDGDLKQDGR